MKGRVCFIAPSVSAGHGSARTPTDKDKVRFGFLLPLRVEDRSVRSRAPIPSRARKEARAPGRELVDQEQEQEQEHDWPGRGAVSPATPGSGRRAMKGRVCFIAPSVSAGHGSARTPRTRRCSLVARGELRAMNGRGMAISRTETVTGPEYTHAEARQDGGGVPRWPRRAKI